MKVFDNEFCTNIDKISDLSNVVNLCFFNKTAISIQSKSNLAISITRVEGGRILEQKIAL